MTIDEDQRRRDLYEVALRAHDARVECDGWIYYVRGVKRDSEFTGLSGWITSALSIEVALLLLRPLQRLVDRRKPWTVGVVRLGSVATWNSLTPKVVHREVLPAGEHPARRIDDLLAEAHDGRFAPD